MGMDRLNKNIFANFLFSSDFRDSFLIFFRMLDFGIHRISKYPGSN